MKDPREWPSPRAVGALLLSCAISAHAPGSSDAATEFAGPHLLHHLEELAPRALGTDRKGRLWAWSSKTGDVVLLSDEGAELWNRSLPAASAVAVDGDWGIALLTPNGRTLKVLRADGNGPEIQLDERAGSLGWIGPDTVAVGSSFGHYRVRLWNLRSGAPGGEVGEEGSIPSDPGAHLARATEIAYDSGRGTIYVLDSFSGRLQAFDLGGKALAEVLPADPERARFDTWLAGVDREARRTGEIQRPAIWRFHLDLAADGAAWMVEKCTSGEAHLLRFIPGGELERHVVSTGCCSRRFAVNDAEVVFYRTEKPGETACAGLGRLQ